MTSGRDDPPVLTPSLAWFARRHLRSPADLEILLLLRRTPDRWWTPADVAAELQTTPAVTLDSLQRLSTSIVASRSAEEPQYRFAPASDEDRRAVDALEALYRHDRFQLVRLIAPPPSPAMQDFADAFELKKKKEEP